MDSLLFVERNGSKYYCFIEVCSSFFPATPKSTIRGWLKVLNIATMTCTAEERLVFRSGNQQLCGSFGLITANDVDRLIDYKASPNKRARKESTSTLARSSACTSTTSTSVPNENESALVVPGTSENMAIKTVTQSDDKGLVDYSGSDDSENEHRDESQSEQAQMNSPVKRRSRSILSLDDAEIELKTEVRSLRKYYEKDLNPTRSGPPLSKASLDKLVERLMGFMFYCQNIEKMPNLSLSLFNDTNLYTKYLEYLRDVRKLRPSTIVNFLTVAINVVKYTKKIHDPLVDIERAPEIQAYRSFTREFSKQSYILKRRMKEGFDKKSCKKFYFAHILETLRNLRDKYFESRGLEKVRHLHNFVLFALYLRAMPGRSKEIRTLQLYLESEKRKPFDICNFETGNFIVFELGENIYLLQSDFKTSKSSGPSKTELSDDVELCHYLNLYANARPTLMLGKSHDFFFLNAYGEPFRSSSSIAKYIGDIFEREVSIRASTTALRHAIVTYFSSIDESKDSNVRKSLAVLMRHSIRYQELVYNDQTFDEKTKAGRNLLRDKIAANVFGAREEFTGENDESANGCSDDDDFVELKPDSGDIVALLDGASTEDNVTFFLAKVARLNEDRSEAHLLHLDKIDGADNLYRLRPGKVWTESVGALIFPVDVVYDSSEKGYELRTSAEDIYKCVHGGN